MKGARRDLWRYAIIYTTEQGGVMKSQPMWATPEQYEEAKRTGYLVDPSKDWDEKIPLAMIALVEAVEVWDFRLSAEEVAV
jgi:hypothetical protein